MPKETTQVTMQEGKTTSKKDKGVSKKARSPYMFFTMEWRDKFKKQDPNAEFGQLTRLMGTKWKELSGVEKAPYVEQHERDKERVATNKQAYEATTSRHLLGQGAPRAITI